MDDDGEQRDLTFDDLEAYTRWPYTDGQLFLAMVGTGSNTHTVLNAAEEAQARLRLVREVDAL